MASSPRYFTAKPLRSLSGDKTTVNAVADLTFEFNEFDIWNVASSPSPKPARESPIPAREVQRSVPVDVPNWNMILKKAENRSVFSDEDEEEEYGGAWIAWSACERMRMVPPHEYLARVRVASCSVHEGVGRTLKGRDLSRVRNAVWKQIGFED